MTVTPDRAFEQIALEDWQANFDLNLVGGVLLPCQEFGPAMVARGKGSIINIASVAAIFRCRASWPTPPPKPPC